MVSLLGARAALPLVAALAACGRGAPPAAGEPLPPAATALAPAAPPSGAAEPPTRPRLDGRAFPAKVLALTWDDGPDRTTLELARYLRGRRISATFFVVGGWIDGLSSDPGAGTGVFATGHESLPILGELTALGHRLGNHTRNHVLLDRVGGEVVRRQLLENQDAIDPFLANELRLFRAPGGAWNDAASRAVDSDPRLRALVGPFGWDADRKDWDASLACASSQPGLECEPAGPGQTSRLRPSVTAARYLATIEDLGRGIVLLHDRVGHVGSRYAIDVARALVPQLEARGYVFAAPVLAFSPLAVRYPARPGEARPEVPLDAPLRLVDVDGDGRADLCGRGPRGIVCATSVRVPGAPGDRRPTTLFESTRIWLPSAAQVDPWAEPGPVAGLDGPLLRGDVDGDGRADVCARRASGLVCALASARGGFRDAEPWSTAGDFGDADGIPWAKDAGYAGTLRLGDLNGDGRADVCGRGPDGVVCALSTGRAFAKATVWLRDGLRDADGWLAPRRAASLQLGDINGDGRADLCGFDGQAVVCALAP